MYKSLRTTDTKGGKPDLFLHSSWKKHFKIINSITSIIRLIDFVEEKIVLFGCITGSTRWKESGQVGKDFS